MSLARKVRQERDSLPGDAPGRFAVRRLRVRSGPHDRARSFTSNDAAQEAWRILLVDDEPTQRLIMARLLKRAGYSVESPATAGKRSRSSPPAISS